MIARARCEGMSNAIEHFPSREAALAAESEAIRTESAQFNIAENVAA